MGKRFPLPISTLNSTTKSLVNKLRVKPDSINVKNNKKVREWKDQSGRTISAEFVKSDNKTVTLIWNGKTTVLPLSMFSQESQEMAFRLQKQKSPIPEIKQPVQKVDLNGELDLQKEYPWQNSQNQTIVGRFHRFK